MYSVLISTMLLHVAIGATAVPNREAFISAVEDAEVRNSAIDTNIIQLTYGLFDQDRARAAMRSANPLSQSGIRWVSVNALCRLEKTTQMAGESAKPTFVELCNGTGTYRWSKGLTLRTIGPGLRAHTGDSGFAAFNQAFGFWFPAGDGPVLALSARLRNSSNWVLEPASNGLMLSFDVEGESRTIHHEMECMLEPVFHVRRYAWEVHPRSGDQNGTMLRREIINDEWNWYGAMYLPGFARSVLIVPASPVDGINTDSVNISEYIRTSAVEIHDPATVQALLEFSAARGTWIYDERIHYGYQIGNDLVCINDLVYRADRPVRISDWSDPMADLGQLALTPLNIKSDSVDAEVDSPSWNNGPVEVGLIAAVLTFLLLTGFRFIGHRRSST